MSMNLVTFLYLIASVCFIQALKGLSHPTTHHFTNSPRLFDKSRITQQHATHRRSQTFAQTQRNTVKHLTIVLGIFLIRHDGIHNSSPIQVKSKSMRIAQ